MPVLTFATSPDGLAVEGLIGLSRAQAQALRAAGQTVPQPVPLRGLIDTGADFTSVADASLTLLRLLPQGPFAVNTANGLAVVVVGMDLLRDCLLIVAGPAGRFSLAS